MDEIKPDWLLCTHDHLDHLDPETVVKIAEKYPECKLAGPISCVNHFKALGIDASRVTLLEIGDVVVFGEFNITPVYAKHSDKDAVGIVISDGEKRIYLTGDSEFDEKLISVNTKNVEGLLICINGRLGNMNYKDAVNVSKLLSAKTAIPMHYGLFAENTEDPAPFVAECRDKGINSFEMTLGEGFEI
jgi:L-ascorbate metabolism protein UlaG (beta-lactamase superfamily)